MIPISSIIALLILELLFNYYVIVIAKKTVNHPKGLARRIIAVFFISAYLFDLRLETVYFFGYELQLPMDTIIYFIGSGLFFWFWFDLILNKLRGKVWNHLGKAAVLDRFDLAGDLEWVIKFLLMLFGGYLII